MREGSFVTHPDFSRKPHRRLNPLTGEWVLVSPQRTQRPWRGQVDPAETPPSVAYDPECYLCPGNYRAGGQKNPNYTSTFVFTNDFPALLPDGAKQRLDLSGRGLAVAESETGICHVICFSPRHDLTLSRMTVDEITAVINVWVEQYAELGQQKQIQYVQIFENRGEMMGCSNPHPHCQVWATGQLPTEPLREQQSQAAYTQANDSCLLCDYLAMEQRVAVRMISENEHFAVLVPYWAVWPFETLVVSKAHLRDVCALGAAGWRALADILKRLTTRYDNLFRVPFPYSMGFHQAPTDDKKHKEWHLHAHFYPPLLRSATVRKFLVGYEMLAEPQRDLTPEAAADRLRAASEVPGV